MFAIFSDDEVVTNEELYDALQEIKHASFPLYVHSFFLESSKNLDDDFADNLKAHAFSIENEETECYQQLARLRDRFCFNSVIFAKYMIEKYRSPLEFSTMKIAQTTAISDFFVHIFSKNSPFIKIFDRKFQQILESGLGDSIHHAKKYLRVPEKSQKAVEF